MEVRESERELVRRSINNTNILTKNLVLLVEGTNSNKVSA